MFPIIEQSFPQKIKEKRQPQQQQTTNDKLPDSYCKLQPIYQYMIDLKLSFWSYSMITKEIEKVFHKQYKEQSIRQLFISSDGLCYPAWQEMLKVQDAQRESEKELVAKGFEEMLRDSVAVAKRALQGETLTPEQIAFANSTFDRTGYGRASKQDINGKIDASEDFKEFAKTMRMIAEKK